VSERKTRQFWLADPSELNRAMRAGPFNTSAEADKHGVDDTTTTVVVKVFDVVGTDEQIVRRVVRQPFTPTLVGG
jgi:hypothetical protein